MNNETHYVCNKHNIGGKSVCCECSGKTDCGDSHQEPPEEEKCECYEECDCEKCWRGIPLTRKKDCNYSNCACKCHIPLPPSKCEHDSGQFGKNACAICNDKCEEESWEKEFDKKFDEIFKNCGVGYGKNHIGLKSFIKSLLATQREEALKEGYNQKIGEGVQYAYGKEDGKQEERQRLIEEVRKTIIWQLKDKKERKYYDEFISQL